MTQNSLFEFDGLVCGYGEAAVLREVSGSVRSGEVLAVVGRNGVGKSTLLRALAGALPLMGGSVRWEGRDLAAVPLHARLALGISFTPQEAVVFGDLSVGDNLWLHLLRRDPTRYAQAFAHFPLLAVRQGQRAGALSGGERKLLSFARATGLGARLTLLDEPTEGVQPENIQRMASLVLALKAAGSAFVIVEQNIEFVEAVADRLLILDHGQVRAQGSQAELTREAITRFLAL